MCGIVGMVSTSPVNQDIYDALTVLQHRGQDAAGIVTTENGRLYLRKENGLVRDVFRTDHMLRLVGNAGVGHVREVDLLQDSFVRAPRNHLGEGHARPCHLLCHAQVALGKDLSWL